VNAAPSIDLHADTVMAIVHEGHRLDGTTPQLGAVDAPRMRAGALDAQFFAIFVSPYWTGDEAPARAHALMDALERELARPEVGCDVGLARTVTEMDALRGEDRLAAWYGLEGGHALGGSLSPLDGLAARGVRYLTLTWSNSNALGDSSGSVPVHGGLSALGRQAVGELERLGILVDVSHIADSSLDDVLEVAEAPVIASHSCCRALHPHPRNLTDEQIRAIAATGGLIGIAFHSAFLMNAGGSEGRARWRDGGSFADPLTLEQADRQRISTLPQPAPLERLADHILHALEVAGPDHVALGSDFDGRIVPPLRLADVAALPRLRRHLGARGVPPAVLDAVWGGNVRRVLLGADRRRLAAGL
jgi:membrane dipeptidase